MGFKEQYFDIWQQVWSLHKKYYVSSTRIMGRKSSPPLVVISQVLPGCHNLCHIYMCERPQSRMNTGIEEVALLFSR